MPVLGLSCSFLDDDAALRRDGVLVTAAAALSALP